MQTRYKAFKLSFAIALLLLAASVFAAERYQVDTAHTYILFKVKHFNIGYSYGRFDGPTGSIVWDDDNPDVSSIEMTVNAVEVNTADDKRDQHIRSADFLNVEKYAAIVFKSTSVKKLSADTYEVAGELTLLGKTRPIALEVRQTGVGKDPWGSYRRGFETKFIIKRSDWGMDFMLNGVSDEVELTVSIEGIRQ